MKLWYWRETDGSKDNYSCVDIDYLLCTIKGIPGSDDNAVTSCYKAVDPLCHQVNVEAQGAGAKGPTSVH